MRIFNITDMAKGTNVKAIHIGDYRILPGEHADVPDSIAYVKEDGRKVALPAILALARTNQIRYEETAATAPAGDGNTGTNGEGGNVPVASELTDEEKKKAEAAAKRAATRAANKAAKADSASKTE